MTAISARRPNLMWCYAVLAPAVIFVMTGTDRGYQTDLWHHLARGREICAAGEIVSRDLFTYTVPDQPFVDNNWLTQTVAWQLYRLGGIDLVQAVNSLLLAATMAIAVGLGMRLGASPRVCAGVGVAMVAGLAQTLLIRPQTVSMLLFTVLLAVLVRRREVWLTPLILAVWANVHGAFPIGLVLIGCFVLAGQVKWWWGGVAAVATLANPYGWRVYEYVFTTSSRATDRVIQEWLRPDVTSLSGGFWLATVLAVLALAVVRRSQLQRWMWVALPVFAMIAATSVRMSIWWYLAAGPVVMALWPPRQRRPAPPSAVAAGFYAAMVAAMVVCLPAWGGINPVFRMRSPERLETSLQSLADAIPPNSRVFSRLEWGEYFGFALPWRHSVFMDGRIEIYGDGLWDEYRRISSAEPDWQDLLDKYQVSVLVLDRHYHDGLLDRMEDNPNWHEIASAGTGVVYVKR